MRTFDRASASEIAHSWSSVMTWNDPGVVLYAFASTGKVQSQRHRRECLAYIRDNCRKAADVNIAAGEYLDGHEELDALAAYIRAAPIEREKVHG